MSDSPTIIARPPTEARRTERRISRIFRQSVPPELLKSARGRVGNLSMFILVITAISMSVALAAKNHTYFGDAVFFTPTHFFVILLISSAILFALTRVKAVSNQRLLDFALIYEIIIAFGTGVFRHSIPWTAEFVRDWSEVAVWIVVFAVVIPNARWKTALAAILAGLMDPLGLLIALHAGLPMPPGMLVGSLFGPTFFAVILGIVLSRFIFRMGFEIEEARKLGSYRLVERLGKGGMGEVWRAEHRMLARPAAVKLIPPDILTRGDAINAQRRFKREANATAMLESEHTIRLYDYGVTQDGVFYYVMEYLVGLDLDGLVERFGPLRPERTVYLLQQVCQSLAEAHHNGLIHRDIKPANIYICRRGLSYDVTKVLDFGLAKWSAEEAFGDGKLTVDGGIAGTPAFIAPEVVLGEPNIDGRADIYAVGCVAFWMLTGRLVFEADTPMKLLVAHANAEPPELSVLSEWDIPVDLETIVVDCLRKDPADRPQSASELSNRLAAIQFDRPWTAGRAEAWWQKYKPDSHAEVQSS